VVAPGGRLEPATAVRSALEAVELGPELSIALRASIARAKASATAPTRKEIL